MTDHLWYPEVARSVATGSHCFLHYGAYHRVDEFGKVIHGELLEQGYNAELINIQGGRSSGATISFRPAEATDVAVITNMERLTDSPRALEQLRSKANDWASRNNRKILIVSRSPRSHFPVGDGSSLVLDSKDIHLKESSYADWVISEAEQHIQGIPGKAARSRGLAAKLEQAISDKKLPGAVEEIVHELSTTTLHELGSSYISWLDEWITEAGETKVPLIDVPEWMQVELLISGVAETDVDQNYLHLFPAPLGIGWQSGLKSASRRCTSAPSDWRETSASLFEIERIVRKILADSLETSLGKKWAKQVLHKEEETYIRDAANMATTVGLDKLANPLDYLTLGQLLDIAEKRTEGRTAGLNQRILADLKRLIPIRNRIVHMRLPKPEDLTTVRSTLRRFQLALKSQAPS
ncbi:hypothetical protein [Amycolatopsis japonica]